MYPFPIHFDVRVRCRVQMNAENKFCESEQKALQNEVRTLARLQVQLVAGSTYIG